MLGFSPANSGSSFNRPVPESGEHLLHPRGEFVDVRQETEPVQPFTRQPDLDQVAMGMRAALRAEVPTDQDSVGR